MDGEAYVLRLGCNETTYLGVDRQVEYDCFRLAAQIGVALELIAFPASEVNHRIRFYKIGTPKNVILKPNKYPAATSKVFHK